MGYTASELQIQENRLCSNITIRSKQCNSSFAKDKRENIDTVEMINKHFIFFTQKRKKEEALRL